MCDLEPFSETRSQLMQAYRKLEYTSMCIIMIIMKVGDACVHIYIIHEHE